MRTGRDQNLILLIPVAVLIVAAGLPIWRFLCDLF